jgi:general secretion pathway protein A
LVEVPSSNSSETPPLYEAFYGFKEQPFSLSSDPRFLYLSGSHRRAYEELLTGLRRREGLLVLTGETGTGKTTLCHAVIQALGARTFSALILNPYMTDAEVVRVVLRDFGLVSRDEIRRGALAKADMPQLLDTLEAFLRSLLPLDSYAVLIIDEAQSLSPQVLDQVRMLGGYEHEGQRLLQIVLCGQPALTNTLREESIRALNERVTRRNVLMPLPPAEVEAYIRHRLEIAGGTDRVVFQPGAVWMVADLSRGLPRRVNLLCDRALEEGRLANTNDISADLIKKAARAVAGPSVLASQPEEAEPDPEPDPASITISKPTPVDVPLTFGVEPEQPKTGHRLRTAIITLFVLLGAAIGMGAYAQSLFKDDFPPLPPAPKLDVGHPPPPIPLPNERDLSKGLQAMKKAGE